MYSSTRSITILLGLILLAPAFALAMPLDRETEAPATRMVVGYEGTVPAALIEQAGGVIKRVDTLLEFAVVVTTVDPTEFAERLAPFDVIRYVEIDSLLGHDGASSDGSRWNGASWDGSNWDGSNWDGAQWDGSNWDGSNWDGAQWDGSNWDGSNWDGAQWDGSNWDGAQWDGAQWDGSHWDGAQWDGSASDGTTGAGMSPDDGYRLQWGLGALRLPTAWNTTIGDRSVVVCVVDSGVDYNHPDLAPQMWTAPDGTHGFNVIAGTRNPMDYGGHGTHVAGIIAASIGNGVGIAGVANAQIMAVRALRADGSGEESDVATGIGLCANNGARIISLSLGGEIEVLALRDAVAYARNRGVLLVASTGNAGCDCPRFPASFSGVIGVGAIDARIEKTNFSNAGGHVDVVAPGLRIVSTFPGNAYAIGSGTSQATPYVSGVAALMLSKNPNLTPAQLESIIQSTAVDRGAAGKDRLYGYGMVDAAAALALAMSS